MTSIDQLLTPDQMAECDRDTISAGVPGLTLMERAGTAVFMTALKMRRGVQPVAVLCGPGNNGGDGYVVARLLAQHGVSVCVFSLGDTASLTGDAAAAYAQWIGCLKPTDLAQRSNHDQGTGKTASLDAFNPSNHQLIIDALFGAGLRRPIDGVAAEIVDDVNNSDAVVLAVDLPSGIDGRTGRNLGTAIYADRTVTFCRAKPGHYLADGRRATGRLTVADIGIVEDVVAKRGAKLWRGTRHHLAACFAPPPATVHKYQRGAVAVCAGSPFSAGAAKLAAHSALVSGAGLVSILAPTPTATLLAPALGAVMLAVVQSDAQILNEIVRRKCSAVVIGPGFGDFERLRDLVLAVCKHAGQHGYGLVLDADALTAFEGRQQYLFDALHHLPSPAVLTPHGGEFRRLFPELEGDNKAALANEAAVKSGAVVLFKGPDTVIASPDGRAIINTTGSAALATAGSGDTLTGVIAAGLARGLDSFQAAAAGAYLHGLAGQTLGAGATADLLIPRMCEVFATLTTDGG